MKTTLKPEELTGYMDDREIKTLLRDYAQNCTDEGLDGWVVDGVELRHHTDHGTDGRGSKFSAHIKFRRDHRPEDG